MVRKAKQGRERIRHSQARLPSKYRVSPSQQRNQARGRAIHHRLNATAIQARKLQLQPFEVFGLFVHPEDVNRSARPNEACRTAVFDSEHRGDLLDVLSVELEAVLCLSLCHCLLHDRSKALLGTRWIVFAKILRAASRQA